MYIVYNLRCGARPILPTLLSPVGFPSPAAAAAAAAAGGSPLSFRTDGQAGRSSGDALSHMLFGMDLREPETLQTMNKYFLEVQKENIRLESAESILSHENTEIIRENEELKQRWAAAEKEAQMAIAEVRAVRAKVSPARPPPNPHWSLPCRLGRLRGHPCFVCGSPVWEGCNVTVIVPGTRRSRPPCIVY